MSDQARYVASVVAPARPESVRASAAFLVQAARSLGAARAAEPLFETALVEAITNALRHGAGTPDSWIVCEIEETDAGLLFRVLDPGPGFSIERARRPTRPPTDVQQLAESGYGLHVIRAVFPEARTIRRENLFGLELPLAP